MKDPSHISVLNNPIDQDRMYYNQSDNSKNTGKWTCPTCHEQYSNEIQFCRLCGSKKPLQSSEVCQCGRRFKPGERFCRSCGTRRPESEVEESPQVSEVDVSSQVVCECGRVFLKGELFCPNCSKKKSDMVSAPVSVVEKYINNSQPTDDQNTLSKPVEKVDQIESDVSEKLSSEKKRCSLCGLEVEESELFCPACGAKIRKSKNITPSKTQAASRSIHLAEESEKTMTDDTLIIDRQDEGSEKSEDEGL